MGGFFVTCAHPLGVHSPMSGALAELFNTAVENSVDNWELTLVTCS